MRQQDCDAVQFAPHEGGGEGPPKDRRAPKGRRTPQGPTKGPIRAPLRPPCPHLDEPEYAQVLDAVQLAPQEVELRADAHKRAGEGGGVGGEGGGVEKRGGTITPPKDGSFSLDRPRGPSLSLGGAHRMRSMPVAERTETPQTDASPDVMGSTPVSMLMVVV